MNEQGKTDLLRRLKESKAIRRLDEFLGNFIPREDFTAGDEVVPRIDLPRQAFDLMAAGLITVTLQVFLLHPFRSNMTDFISRLRPEYVAAHPQGFLELAMWLLGAAVIGAAIAGYRKEKNSSSEIRWLQWIQTPLESLGKFPVLNQLFTGPQSVLRDVIQPATEIRGLAWLFRWGLVIAVAIMVFYPFVGDGSSAPYVYSTGIVAFLIFSISLRHIVMTAVKELEEIPEADSGEEEWDEDLLIPYV